jgi:hypothetical protein
MTPIASYDGRDEAVQCARNTNASSGHPTAVIDSQEKKGQRAVDVFSIESFYQSRRSDIEIIGGFTDRKLKGREILGWRIDKGWVHVCYLRDLKDYLAKQHYNTPGHIEILRRQRKPDSHARLRQNSPGGSKRALKPSNRLSKKWKNLTARTSWRTTILFLAFLISSLIGQRAGAQEQPGPDYALVIDVYSGTVEPATLQEKNFSMELEKLYKGVQPDAAWLPKVIHIDHVLSDKEFDVAGQGETNGQKVVVRGHVSRQVDGRYNMTFSELGPRAYHGATEFTLRPDERRVWRLPVSIQSDSPEPLETVVVISIQTVTK